jgi:hypothetical protein
MTTHFQTDIVRKHYSKPRYSMTVCDQVYRFLVSYKESHDGNSPTMREIIEGAGVSSTSMVAFYLDKLEAENLICRPIPATGKRMTANIEILGGKWILEGGSHVQK